MSFYSIKTREQRCRRYLKRVGMELHKSRVRTWWADTYGMYALAKPNSGAGKLQYDWDLDEVEDYVKYDVIPELLERSRYNY